MTYDEMKAAIADITYEDYQFILIVKNGLHFLQGVYKEQCVDSGRMETQKTRKWVLSDHVTKSEIIQTALKLCLTSAEHRVREHFLYKGSRVFGPHFSVDDLKALADNHVEDHRPQTSSFQPDPRLGDGPADVRKGS